MTSALPWACGSGPGLASKPSTAFSLNSSASATSATGSIRSAGSRLLFGEIDTSSDRSSTYASVNSFVLSDSSTFLKFWLDDRCRDTLLSCLPAAALASLRLAGHDFSVRAAPALFSHLTITFRAATFTKPARLAALDRIGFHVQTLDFRIPHHSVHTFLPPLVDPATGAELSFTYTPHVLPPTLAHPKYGDLGTTDLLTRQWPPLFHAATNVPAFIRAFSAFINLCHLRISCPDFDPSQRSRRSIVDFALTSVRLAIEHAPLHRLNALTLDPIHPAGLLHLSPLLGYGNSPRAMSRWRRVTSLAINAYTLPPMPTMPDVDAVLKTVAPEEVPAGLDHHKLLHAYLRAFQSSLQTFRLRWIDKKDGLPDVYFPSLVNVDFRNICTSASSLARFTGMHKRTLTELNLEAFEFLDGDWEQGLKPLMERRHYREHPPPKRGEKRRGEVAAARLSEQAEILIMLDDRHSPSSKPFPSAASSSSTQATPTRMRRRENALPDAPGLVIQAQSIDAAVYHEPEQRQQPQSEDQRPQRRQPSAPRPSKAPRLSTDVLPVRFTSLEASAPSVRPRRDRGGVGAASKVREGLAGCEEHLRKVFSRRIGRCFLRRSS